MTDPTPPADDSPAHADRPVAARAPRHDDSPRRERRYRQDEHYDPPRPRGILPRKAVRLTCFWVITLSLAAAGVVCILAVWDYAKTDVAWRAAASLGIVVVIMLAFAVLNEAFGTSAERYDD